MKHTLTTLTLPLLLIGFLLIGTSKQNTLLYEEIPVHHADQSLVIEGEFNEVVLKTANGCGLGNYMIAMRGDSSNGIPPRLGSPDLWSGGPFYADTLPGKEIKGVMFRRQSWLENTSIITTSLQDPYVAITDVGMFSYEIPNNSFGDSNLEKIDSLFIPGIVKVAQEITTDAPNPIVLFTKDPAPNLHFYSYAPLAHQSTVSINYEPEVMQVNDGELFTTGLTGNVQTLFYYGTGSTAPSYPLNEMASNAQELIIAGDSVFILSSPGDSMVVLTTVDLITGNLVQTVVYSNSGARATHNEYLEHRFFTFQPKADTSGAQLDRQITVLNPLTGIMTIVAVNLELDYFKQPKFEFGGFGYVSLEWVGAKWNDSGPDIFYSPSTLPCTTDGFPDFTNATYGCWVSNSEIPETDKIEFEMYPNPASTTVSMSLKGLTKGTRYDLEIVDSSGKLLHSDVLYAYQKLQLPLEGFPKGIYFLRLNTGKNIISQKLVIQ